MLAQSSWRIKGWGGPSPGPRLEQERLRRRMGSLRRSLALFGPAFSPLALDSGRPRPPSLTTRSGFPWGNALFGPARGRTGTQKWEAWETAIFHRLDPPSALVRHPQKNLARKYLSLFTLRTVIKAGGKKRPGQKAARLRTPRRGLAQHRGLAQGAGVRRLVL